MNKKAPILVGPKNELIVQHNNLIEARYHLTLQEKRLMCWLASKVKPMDEDFKEHELSIKEFASLLEIKGDHLYKTLDLVTHKLMQKIITIRSLDKNQFEKAALLGGVRYYGKEGIIKLSFHPYLKPYMLQLKERFTQVRLGDLLGLKSIHSIRLYELLKQYEAIGDRTITLTDLREYNGIAPNQYKKFNNFKKDVLERAKQEINAKTDLLIDYQEIKRSRKVSEINFTIRKNPNFGKTEFEKMQEEKARVITAEMNSQNTLIESLMKYGFSRPLAKRFFQQTSEQVIQKAVKAVNIQIEKGQAKNPKAMFKVAVQEQWEPEVFTSQTQKHKNRKALEELDDKKPSRSKKVGQLALQILKKKDELKQDIITSSEPNFITLLRTEFLSFFGEASYISWFKDIVIREEADHIIFSAPTPFVSDYLQITFGNDIRKILGKLLFNHQILWRTSS